MSQSQRSYRRKRQKLGLVVIARPRVKDEYTDRLDLTPQQKFKLRNPEAGRLATKKHREKRPKSVQQQMISNAKTRAKNKNCPFDITEEDILVPEFCPILDIPLIRSKGAPSNNSPSLDKIIPELGYVKDNIRVISYRANTYKNNLNRDQIQRLLDYVDRKI